MNKPILDFLYSRRKALFFGTLLFLVGGLFLFPLPRFSGDLNGFDLEGNELQETAMYADSLFGDRNKIYIHILPKDTTTQAVFSGVNDLENKLKQEFPGAKQFSLSTLFANSIQDQPRINEFLESGSEVSLFKDIISNDRRSFLLILSQPIDQMLNVEQMDSLLARKYAGIKQLEALSLFHIQHTIESHIRQDLFVISLGIIVFFLAFYWYLYRSYSAMLFTAVHITTTILAALIIFSIVGVNLNIITILVIPVVLVLALADSVHLITGMAKHHMDSIEEKAKKTLGQYIIPSAYSSLTTGIAFFTFYYFNGSEYIRDFGLICGVALLVEFFLTFLLSPFMMEHIRVDNVYGKKIVWIDEFLYRKRKAFSFLFLGLLVASFFFVTRLGFNTTTEIFFPVNSRLAEIHENLNKKFYSQVKLDILISGTSDKNVALQRFVQRVSKKIKEYPEVVRVSSLTEVSGSTDLLIVPVKRLESNPFYNGERNVYRVEVAFRNGDLVKDFYQDHYPEIVSLAGKDFQLKATSPVLLMDFINQNVAGSLVTSLATSCLSIVLLILILTRSVSLTLLSIIPNLVPLGIVAIVFVLFDLDLNILTAITAVVCLGILDDDTIHILYRKIWLKKELEEVSFSIFSTSVLLAVGFGFFLFSSFQPTKVFGMISAIVFMIGVMSDLTFMPWVIDIWEKFKKKK